METRTVHYGDTSVKISSFRSYKAFVAGDILGSASEQINELIEDYNSFRKEYREKNTVELTKRRGGGGGHRDPRGGVGRLAHDHAASAPGRA